VPKAARNFQRLLKTIKKRADFLAAAKSGLKRGTNSFNLQANPNNLEESRVGYTVSKHVSKLAVVRNRIKRRLKAAVKENEAHFPTGYDFVFIGKIDAEERNFELLKGDIKYALKKIFTDKTL